MVAYLHARQYLPVARMAEMFEHILGLPIGEGSIINMIARFAQKADAVYEDIKSKVLEASCIGSDETGCKVNGRKNWFWTWQNAMMTLIIWAKSRGSITIEQTFPNGLPNAVLVSDRLSAQLGTNAKGHQVCIAHLLRDLNFIEQSYGSGWAKDFKTLFKEALELGRQLQPGQYCSPNPQRDSIELRLRQLLEQPLPKQHHKAITLQKQLKKIPGYILLFLYHPDVPPHNNGSEKAIRNVKVKQKISGQFKSEDGAKAFAIIRSVIDTAIKSGKDVFDELAQIANKHKQPPVPA
jgi:transposase